MKKNINQQVVVIHGGNAFDNYQDYLDNLKKKEISLEKLYLRGWKENLGNDLGEGFDVLAPRMPNSQNARYLEWKIWFEKIIPFLDDNLIFIGHSLGGIFLVKYLTENNYPKKIKAVLLVGIPYNTPTRHPLADFNITKPLANFTRQAGKIVIFHSKDDKIVPFSNAKQFLKEIPNAVFNSFKDRGHFNQETFPEIIKLIKNL